MTTCTTWHVGFGKGTEPSTTPDQSSCLGVWLVPIMLFRAWHYAQITLPCYYAWGVSLCFLCFSKAHYELRGGRRRRARTGVSLGASRYGGGRRHLVGTGSRERNTYTHTSIAARSHSSHTFACSPDFTPVIRMNS